MYKILHIPSALYVTDLYSLSFPDVVDTSNLTENDLIEALRVCEYYQIYKLRNGNRYVMLSDDFFRTSKDIRIITKDMFEIVEVDDVSDDFFQTSKDIRITKVEVDDV